MTPRTVVATFAAEGPSAWAGTWATAVTGPATTPIPATTFEDQTLRQIVHTSIAGRSLRVRLSNEYGCERRADRRLSAVDRPGAGYYSEANEAKRAAANRWIRTGGEFDGVVDFDRAVRDPAQPRRLLPRYDSGDHLHPGDEGMRAMADAIPLRLLPVTGWR